MIKIPESFLLGAATSAYQIEGAVHEDGRGESIWDVFSHTPGRTFAGDTGDKACDFYHRFSSDVQMMKNIGLEAFRFSIAWPRLFPTGRGRFNQKGLDFYRKLVESLQLAEIKPVATLYHWDLPQVLMEAGGWTNRETAKRFAEYAHTVFAHLGSDIPIYITLNEPWCSAVLGHLLGEHAPGEQDLEATIAASHHLLLAHGLALQAFRDEHLTGAQIGITNTFTHLTPASSNQSDKQATETANTIFNRWFVHPLFYGSYPSVLQSFGIDRVTLPSDLQVIQRPIDFLGVNYYTASIVKANPADPWLGATLKPANPQRTAMDWAICPEGLYEVLKWLHENYPHLPMYITENGAAFPDKTMGEPGKVEDKERINFIHNHLQQALKAVDKGIDVRGYFAWSLLDNYEWAFGYSKRFGLVYVDYATGERFWKQSAHWYQNVIQTRSL